MQIISQPLASLDLLNGQARFAVRQRRKEQEAPEHNGQDNARRNPAAEHALRSDALADGLGQRAAVALGRRVADGWRIRVHRLDVEDELDEGTCDEDRREMRGEIVVQEQLATHNVEGNVVGRPGKEEEAGRVVEARAGAWLNQISTWT